MTWPKYIWQCERCKAFIFANIYSGIPVCNKCKKKESPTEEND